MSWPILSCKTTRWVGLRLITDRRQPSPYLCLSIRDSWGLPPFPCLGDAYRRSPSFEIRSR